MERAKDRREGGGRTDAEREAARLERERRRATRRGEPQEDTVSETAYEGLARAAVAVEEEPAEQPSYDGSLVEEEDAMEPSDDGSPGAAEAEQTQAAEIEQAQAERTRAVTPRVHRGRLQRRKRREPRQRREGHSMRARAGAIVGLVLVALAVWAAVLLVRHLRRSGASSGTISRPPVVKVLIPEGETRAQIAAIARKDGLRGDYMRASSSNPGLQPRRFGAPAGTPSLEGFLFPATYEVRVHGSVNELVADQLEAFHERFGPQLEHSARALGLTSYQLLIVASMIEREAQLPHDRPLVAAVIYNRLRLGMPLGIDATIRYALNDFAGPLTEADLKTPSPYNTRLHAGLPPTPISNPGMEAIAAAAHPAHTAYLYYVDGADGCGDLVFSDTEAEFERNKAAYEEALRQHGGHLPACKRR